MSYGWFLAAVLTVLFLFGCAALYHYRQEKQPPSVVVIITDIHGTVSMYEIIDIKHIKIMTAAHIEFEHEYIDEQLPSKFDGS